MEKMNEIFARHDREEKEKLAMQPRFISIQRKKLLIALKEIPDELISDEDLQHVFQYNNRGTSGFVSLFKLSPSPWENDSKAYEEIDKTLKKHARFELSKYLGHAEAILLAYSGVTTTSPGLSMEYILTHSRQFGHPHKNIFETDFVTDDTTDEEELDEPPAEPRRLPNSKVFNEIGQLMSDLRSAYDERNFQILNANVTYFTLLMLRRVVKNAPQFLNAFKKTDTHDSYVKLCPFPLGTELPKCGFVEVFESWLADACALAVGAYLRTHDARTRRALRSACVQLLEWHGLHLPRLFRQVLDLYEVPAGRLFDALLSVDWRRDNILPSLSALADAHYRMHRSSKAGHTHDWFPFCRLLNDSFECDLSANRSTILCIVLAYLVDMKLGFDKSTVRRAHWVKPQFNESCKEFAEIMQHKLE